MCSCAIISSMSFIYMLQFGDKGNNKIAILFCSIYVISMIIGYICESNLRERIEKLEKEMKDNGKRNTL